MAEPLRGKKFLKSGVKPGKARFTKSRLSDEDSSAIYTLAKAFQQYYHLPDPGALYALLGAVAANMIQGNDPVWLMLVGPSGSGKTALLKSLAKLPGIYLIGDIDSKAALLSGVKKKEQAAGSKGGMLNVIGNAGAVVWYEFTAVLELPKEALKSILTALRQIFDGYYSRDVGTEGHRKLTWQGKMAAFGGVTNAIDTAHDFTSRMGERWIYYRLAGSDGFGESLKALETEDNGGLKDDLADQVAGMFDLLGLDWFKADFRVLEQGETMRMIDLGQFATSARSPVERDQRTREIVGVPQSEMPMRFTKTFRRLYLGMEMIGVHEEDRWAVLKKIALDSMPLVRKIAVECMLAGKHSETEIGNVLMVSQTTVKRTLEDLKVHGVVRKMGGAPRTGDADEYDVVQEGKGKGWELTPWAKEKLK